jgi:hypothetical protein
MLYLCRMHSLNIRRQFKNLPLFRQLIFVLITVLVTTLSFHNVLAAQPIFDGNDPMKDENLPRWCPPSADTNGLAVICGTVVINDTVDVGISSEIPFQPVPNIMVAAYEENPFSSTGRLAGELTNVFSSTYTNEEGKYRLAVRRTSPPNLKVTIVFFCGSTKVREDTYDSWHNTWNNFTQINCTPDIQALTQDNSIAINEGQPPMPLEVPPSSFFFGCTNKPFSDASVGLAKKYEPVVNNIISEKNRSSLDTKYNTNRYWSTHFGRSGKFNKPWRFMGSGLFIA